MVIVTIPSSSTPHQVRSEIRKTRRNFQRTKNEDKLERYQMQIQRANRNGKKEQLEELLEKNMRKSIPFRRVLWRKELILLVDKYFVFHWDINRSRRKELKIEGQNNTT